MSELGPVTIRELHTQIGSLRSEMNARLDKIESSLESKFDKHEMEHDQEEYRRSSRLRWGVTSILTGIGVITAIAIPLLMR